MAGTTQPGDAGEEEEEEKDILCYLFLLLSSGCLLLPCSGTGL